MYASVIIEYSVKKLDKEFIYMIPNDLKDKIKVGMKVLVPFGYQEVVGFVMELLENVDDTTYELKYITQIVDEKLVLNKELLDLGTFLSSSTLCTKISAFQTMLPSSLKVKKNTSNYDLYDEYIYIKDNHLIHFSNPISILESNKIQEGLLVKKENIEETNINELKNANKSYYKMSNDSFNEIINLLTDFTKLSKDNAEKTIEKEFKDYVVRKRK